MSEVKQVKELFPTMSDNNVKNFCKRFNKKEIEAIWNAAKKERPIRIAKGVAAEWEIEWVKRWC